MSGVVLVTGAGGWLGGLLAKAVKDDPLTRDVKLILADVVDINWPSTSDVIVLKADLTDKLQVDALFKTAFGIPETVYCMHGIMSRGSEDHFDIGVKINVDSVRSVLESARSYGTKDKPIKFIFTSSLAVYGGPLPDVITPSTIATPESSYGFGKLICELFINEYTRRGFVDGRILRLPTIVVRPGPPSNATSAFLSGIIREPLRGIEAICPIGNSFDAPELSLRAWLASPETTIKNLVFANHIPASKFLSHPRVVCLPGFTASVREELDALIEVAGHEVLNHVKFKDDSVNRRIVSSWPAAFDNTYPLNLGFICDDGGMIPIVRKFQKDLKADFV